MNNVINMNRYKTDQGVLRLRGLFFEETGSDKFSVLYTLKDVDHEGYPSLQRLYLEMEDPTEYKFANTYLDGWKHWERLCESSWFKPYINRWRKELELKIRSKALKQILKMADAETRESFNANRYLLSGGWKEGKVGRPTKDNIKDKAYDEYTRFKEVQSDIKRMSI